MIIKCPHCGKEFEAEERTEPSVPASGDAAAVSELPADAPRKGRFAVRRNQGDSSRAEHVTIPSRFALSQNDTASASPSGASNAKFGKKKALALIGFVVAVIVAVCAVEVVKWCLLDREPCSPCGGTGTIVCARCKGNGEIVVKGNKPCPTCVGVSVRSKRGWLSWLKWWDSGDSLVTNGSERRGQVKKQVVCGTCHGDGRIRRVCSRCGGKKKVAVEKPGRIGSTYVRCSACDGSGCGRPERCPRCNGCKKLEEWQTCGTCQGRGEVANDGKESCPVCGGKGKLKCERCGGKGFTYRYGPKDGVAL